MYDAKNSSMRSTVLRAHVLPMCPPLLSQGDYGKHVNAMQAVPSKQNELLNNYMHAYCCLTSKSEEEF